MFMFNGKGNLWFKKSTMSTRPKQFYTLLQSQPFLLPPTSHQTSSERSTWLRTLSIHGTPKITKKVKSQATGILGKHSWIQQRLVQRLDLLTKCCWVSITQPSIVPVTRSSQRRPGGPWHKLSHAWKQMSRPSNVLGSTPATQMVDWERKPWK